MEIRKTILIVDDTPANISMLSSLLKDRYKTKIATNGAKALKLAAATPPPDLILLDIMMPEMDGFAFCSWIRSNKDFKEKPIVLLTGVGKHIYESRYPLKGVMQADADEYLEKPLKPEALLETISRLLKT